MSDKVHHAHIAGKLAKTKGVPRENNWYEKVRPSTTDSVEWFKGWDKAELELVGDNDE